MISSKEIKNKINKVIENCNTKMTITQIAHIEDYYIVTIYGGNNGNGLLQDYLMDILSIVTQFENIWLIDCINDCLDDKWTLRLGIQ